MASLNKTDIYQITLAKQHFSKKISDEYKIYLVNVHSKTKKLTLQQYVWREIQKQTTDYYNFIYNS